MSYLIVELFVPRNDRNLRAIIKFYSALRWLTWPDTEDRFLIYVTPNVEPSPVLGYWLTLNSDTQSAFRAVGGSEQAKTFVNSHELVLPAATESVLVLKSDESVSHVWELAQSILTSQNATIEPMRYKAQYPKAIGFRFQDPFGHRIRVTTDPGYELHPHKDMSTN
jgi:hypothetical protein